MKKLLMLFLVAGCATTGFALTQCPERSDGHPLRMATNNLKSHVTECEYPGASPTHFTKIVKDSQPDRERDFGKNWWKPMMNETVCIVPDAELGEPGHHCPLKAA